MLLLVEETERKEKRIVSPLVAWIAQFIAKIVKSLLGTENSQFRWLVVINSAVISWCNRPFSEQSSQSRVVTNRFLENLLLNGWLQIAFRNPWSWEALSRFQKKSLWFQAVTGRFRKAEFVFLKGYKPLSDKKKTDLTSGCSPSPTPTPHLRFGLVSCRLNHTLCVF